MKNYGFPRKYSLCILHTIPYIYFSQENIFPFHFIYTYRVFSAYQSIFSYYVFLYSLSSRELI